MLRLLLALAEGAHPEGHIRPVSRVLEHGLRYPCGLAAVRAAAATIVRVLGMILDGDP